MNHCRPAAGSGWQVRAFGASMLILRHFVRQGLGLQQGPLGTAQVQITQAQRGLLQPDQGQMLARGQGGGQGHRPSGLVGVGCLETLLARRQRRR